MKKTLILSGFVILLTMFFVLLTTVAANTKATNNFLNGNINASNNEPSNLELLVLSHLVYFNIDDIGTKTGMSLKDLLSSKRYPSITAFKDELSENGLKLDSIAQKSNLSKWRIYAFQRDEQDGFFGVIFQNTETGKFVVSFEGTNSPISVYEDVIVATANEEKELVDSANHLLDKLPKNIDKKNVILTGHSLGGYLAARMGGVKNYITVTFNAFGFNSDYLESLRSDGVIKYENNVTNYDIAADLISEFGVHIGKVVTFPIKSYWLPINHDINTFYEDFIK